MDKVGQMNKFLENNNYQDTIRTIKKLTSVQTSHGKEVESLIKNHHEASHIHSLHNCRQHFKTVKVNLPQTFPENTEEKGNVTNFMKQEFL